MNSTSVGKSAESRAAQYLSTKGFRILERNWRTRYCEVDLVACKQEVVYFVEVKYRRTASAGSGLDYLTPTKLRQMRFAAELWVAQKRWLDEYQLAVIEVSGPDFVVTACLFDL